MALRESCNYYGGTPAPHLTPLVDKMIGTAFPTVKYVADNMAAVLYIANNMEALVDLAQAYETRISALESQVAVLSALVIPKTPTIVAPPLSLTAMG